jgi:hypothetical protein
LDFLDNNPKDLKNKIDARKFTPSKELLRNFWSIRDKKKNYDFLEENI